jgi:amino acid transporter
MRGNSTSLVIIAVGIICLLVAIYYIVPGIYHPLTTDNPNGSHLKHFIAFLALAVVAFVGSRFARNSAQS